eukprot:403337194
MTENGIPQSIVLDLSNLKKKPKFFQCFGFHCTHTYSSNPSLIDLFVSKDGIQFKHWTTLNPYFKEGRQLFSIDPIGPSYKFLEVIIKETYGANRTYMNQIYLMEKHPKFMFMKDELINQTQVSPSKITKGAQPYQFNSYQIRPQNDTQQVFTPEKHQYQQVNQIEHQMNNYLLEKHNHQLSMPSAIQTKQGLSTNPLSQNQTTFLPSNLLSSASKKNDDRFLSQDFFSIQSQAQQKAPINPYEQQSQNYQHQQQYLNSIQKNSHNSNFQGTQPLKFKNTPHFNQINSQQYQNTEQRLMDNNYMGTQNYKDLISHGQQLDYELMDTMQQNHQQNEGILQTQEDGNPNEEQLETDYFMEIISNVQLNFNDLCDKLKGLQSEFENVQAEFQQSVLKSPLKEASKQFSPDQRSQFKSQHLNHNQSQKSSLVNSVTPRENLKQEIMEQCLTFCQNHLNQMTSQRGSAQQLKTTHNLSQSSSQTVINERFLETKLKSVIEQWQKQFFDDYIQPSLMNHYEQMEKKIILSIEKKAPPQSAMMSTSNKSHHIYADNGYDMPYQNQQSNQLNSQRLTSKQSLLTQQIHNNDEDLLGEYQDDIHELQHNRIDSYRGQQVTSFDHQNLSQQTDYHQATEQMFSEMKPMTPSSSLGQVPGPLLNKMTQNHSQKYPLILETSSTINQLEVSQNTRTQDEIKRIAEQLQVKLTAKAQKLRMLQQEQLNTDINEDLRSLQNDFDNENQFISQQQDYDQFNDDHQEDGIFNQNDYLNDDSSEL